VTTAALLVPLVPKALSLRGPAQLEEANRSLAAVNAGLQQEIALRQKVEVDLKRSNTELEQFAYVASHDLQEPLRGIAGCVQILERRYRGKLDERADELIHHAVDGAQRMQSLIVDLLAFSRVVTRGEALEPVGCDSIVKTALANLEAGIREKNAVVTVGELPAVIGDRSQLVQLFQNLIGNALKFTDDTRRPEISVSARMDPSGYWRFEVRDNGIGIEPQYFQRIFRIFQRLHTRAEYPGTGIGLAICQKIVERHGGEIWVESKPGQGSTFGFTLRDAAVAEAAA
jgi:light-regulated signal transduction histidine kinase (bacteriophytochrome)